MSNGPPEHAGPPDHARAQRREDGRIEVGRSPLKELEERIEWDDLSPTEQWLVERIRELEAND